MNKRLLTIYYTLLVMVFFSCKKTPEKIISISPSEFSEEEQIKIGSAFLNAIYQNATTFPVLQKEDHQEAYDYLSVLYHTVLNTAQVENRRSYDWDIVVIKDDEIRTAFFLPGGHLCLYTGLLKYLESESQLLGVIGHELYYADTELMVKTMKEEFGGTLLGDILLDKAVPELPELSAQLPFLSMAEEAVIQADSFFIDLICPFQYGPLGIREIISKSEGSGSEVQWLVNRHVDRSFRVEEIGRHSSECGLPGVSNKGAYRRFKEELLP